MSVTVFDAGEADPQRASRLRLSFRESAALVSTMLYVFTGLAGYVMAEQGDPNAVTTALLVILTGVCFLPAAYFVGRLVKDAKKREQTRDANAADEVRIHPYMHGLEPSAHVNAPRVGDV